MLQQLGKKDAFCISTFLYDISLKQMAEM